MKEETTGFVEIILGITLTNYKGRFDQTPSRNIDWFQSFVSGKGLFQLVLRWEGPFSAAFC